jgi:hypothetical protein
MARLGWRLPRRSFDDGHRCGRQGRQEEQRADGAVRLPGARGRRDTHANDRLCQQRLLPCLQPTRYRFEQLCGVSGKSRERNLPRSYVQSARWFSKVRSRCPPEKGRPAAMVSGENSSLHRGLRVLG